MLQVLLESTYLYVLGFAGSLFLKWSLEEEGA